MATVTKSDKSSNVKFNKERYQAKCDARLAKRKAWRLKKYGAEPTIELTRHTLELFVKWGHRTSECKSAIKTKRFKNSERKRSAFKNHWE